MEGDKYRGSAFTYPSPGFFLSCAYLKYHAKLKERKIPSTRTLTKQPLPPHNVLK